MSPNLKILQTINNIRYHFDFLLKRNFRIVAILMGPQNNKSWQITLETNQHLVNICEERNTISLAVGSLQHAGQTILFDLEYLAQSTNSANRFSYASARLPADESQQFQKIATFLESHFGFILAQVERENLMIESDQYPGRSLNQNGQLP